MASINGYGRDREYRGEGRNQLLEINLISAQKLHRRFKRMKTYAVVYAYPDDKQHTHVNRTGNTEPTWNEKFVIRVDDVFIRCETSAITVMIYAVGNWTTFGRDPLLGTTRILVSTLIRQPRQNVALQIRRPKSLRLQGFLNVAMSQLVNRSGNLSFKKEKSAHRALMNSSRPSSLRYDQKIDEDIEYAFIEQRRLIDKSGPLEMIKEQEKIERKNVKSKIEQWKNELSPDHESSGNNKGRNSKKMKQTGDKFCL
ncbi:hypothetical protein LUZ60_006845 [Juncus effusus]|nr:hypothetical protein LUZ60_006845 [Juncus effusus]